MAEAAVIFGAAGTALTPWERAFFAEIRPFGFILFARNVESPAQLAALTAEMREVAGHDAPILIDQEGGRVARLRPPHWQEWLPVRELGEGDPLTALTALELRYRIIAGELRAVGIDVDCMPLLDVPQLNAHPIIGDRALGMGPEEVAIRGRAVCDGLLAGGVLPVVKHLPGHGRALHDSHESLPVVTAPLDELRAVDFLPFRALRDQAMGMTAHVTYRALDPDRCATLSPRVIAEIRETIGFDGLLMTDDLSMKALSGPMGARAEAALGAGCDLILHCNGDEAEMAAIAEVLPALTGPAAHRADRALSLRKPAPEADLTALRAEYDRLTRREESAVA